MRLESEIVDVLFDGKGLSWNSERLRIAMAARARGTGFYVGGGRVLALGHALPDAAARAQRHVAGVIASAQDVY